MPDMRSFALGLLQQKMNQNPQLANDPRAREFLDILQNNDTRRGEQMANNLCQSYGCSREDAIRKARSYFGC